MLNGLDLFSGIGGLTLALSEWVRPIAYCELDRYCQGVLVSRMESGDLPLAPIWDDVRTLRGSDLPMVDIIYGGFPCQDISYAGRGAGLEGKRSGLFFEIIRIVDELRPPFIFLENVPAITTRGLGTVAAEISRRGYDCRWTTLSAAEVGAPHLRKRWWLLAYRDGQRLKGLTESIGEQIARREVQGRHDTNGFCDDVADSSSAGSHASAYARVPSGKESPGARHEQFERPDWWETEPDVGRVVDGIPFRVDCLRCLGNSVVPLCAREALKRLSGMSGR